MSGISLLLVLPVLPGPPLPPSAGPARPAASPISEQQDSGLRTLRLDECDLSKARQGWGRPRANRSVGGRPLRIAGKEYEHGFGTHTDGVLHFRLDGRVERFEALVGVDSEVGSRGSVAFRVLADGKERFLSRPLRGGERPFPLRIDLRGAKTLILQVLGGEDGIDYDHADWVEAVFRFRGKPPETVTPPRPKPYILTPPPRPEPAIVGARIFGVRPGSPVLYQIAATGRRPMRFSADNLPEGLRLDPTSGRLTGVLKRPGRHVIDLRAVNDLGAAHAKLSLVVGDRIALTPPMGWNSWNCWALAVDDGKIRRAARAMVSSGLIRHGWQYINIDDGWMVKRNSKDPTLGGPTRDEEGRILTNKRFPDMKALTDFIHGLGLKAGIYTSPGPWTCAGYEGAWKHEKQDAQTFAEWGFDFLKYDWCGYGSLVKNPTLAQLQAPYRLMKACLDAQPRDIVFSLCQYGMGKVWEWGARVGGNCWRTTGDIRDSWSSMSGIGFRQDVCAPHAGPGRWNDPDMLVVGKVGWGPKLHPSNLNPDEQYTHISLWCLLAAPLLIGCDLEDLDPFTLNLLTNDEVLAIDQDPLGRAARRVVKKRLTEIWARPLADGSRAVGLFNRDEIPLEIRLEFSSLGLRGPRRLRDLWRQKDLDLHEQSYAAVVPPHGVLLLRLSRP